MDIDLEQANLRDVDEDGRYQAAVLVLDGLLGEAMRLSTIEGIEPTGAFDEQTAKRSNEIIVLEEHLASLRQ